MGYIQGGTTVNSIAQEASVLYEFRSTSQKCLKIMQQNFDNILEDMKGAFTIETELMGVRPGNGDISAEALKAFTEKNAEIIQMFCPGEIDYNAASTDSNIPLSLGISANTIGTIAGKKCPYQRRMGGPGFHSDRNEDCAWINAAVYRTVSSRGCPRKAAIILYKLRRPAMKSQP